MADPDQFPNCMHALAAALHRQRIDPHVVTITLPYPQWWSLWSDLDRRFNGFMTFDGRGAVPAEFHYLGFTFKPAPK